MKEIPSYIFGIDFGATNARIGFLKDGQPVVCQSLEGENFTPSVVRMMAEEDDPVAGRTAKDMAVIYPEYTIQYIRSKLGHVDTIEYGSENDKHTATPVDVSAEILKKLASGASAYTNTTVKDVVITVPAFFGSREKEDLIEAAHKAGLNVLDVITESLAATLYYGCEKSFNSSAIPSFSHKQRYDNIMCLYGPPSDLRQNDADQVAPEAESTEEHLIDTFKNEIICTFDMGGSTLNITVFKMEKGKMTILTTDGHSDLGGRNWDAELIEMVKEKFREQTGYDGEFDSDILQELQLKCEAAKRQLTNVDKTDIPLTIDRKNRALITITREEFESRTNYLLSVAIDTAQQVFDRVAESGSKISKIFLVGGASNMPQVSEALRSVFNVPVVSKDPELAVVNGTCIYLYTLSGSEALPHNKPELPNDNNNDTYTKPNNNGNNTNTKVNTNKNETKVRIKRADGKEEEIAVTLPESKPKTVEMTITAFDNYKIELKIIN